MLRKSRRSRRTGCQLGCHVPLACPRPTSDRACLQIDPPHCFDVHPDTNPWIPPRCLLSLPNFETITLRPVSSPSFSLCTMAFMWCGPMCNWGKPSPLRGCRQIRRSSRPKIGLRDGRCDRWGCGRLQPLLPYPSRLPAQRRHPYRLSFPLNLGQPLQNLVNRSCRSRWVSALPDRDLSHGIIRPCQRSDRSHCLVFLPPIQQNLHPLMCL